MNILALLLILALIGFIIWTIKYLEKNLPKRDKRIIKEYEIKSKNDEIQKAYEDKYNLKVQKIIQSENRKKMYQENIRKGRDYELYISDYFRKRGYQIKPFGILNGKKDKGIDVIIKRNKEITLIQCKNWKTNSSHKIQHKHLKEFIGNTTAFLENNKEKANGYIIKRMFITSNDVLDNSAKHFLRENQILEHRIIQIWEED